MSKRLLNKILSLTLSFAFIFTSSITPAIATPIAEKNSSQVESVLVKQLTPPSEIGSLVDAHITAKSPLVIQLQDLHANYGVQTNIVKLLEFLDSRLGAGNYRVAVEGAQGPVAITELAKITDRPFKAKVCDRLMQEAELTGTEYFSIVNGKPNLLWGVEDQRYHSANVALFQSTYKGKQQLALSLQKLQNDLLPIKDKFYTRAMRRLDKKAADYNTGKIDTADYTVALVKQASKRGIDIAARYPEIAKWTGYAQPDKYADTDKLMTEQADLLKEIQVASSETELQRNIATTANELDVLRRLLVEEVTTEEVRQIAPQMSEILGRAQHLLDSTGLPHDKANLTELVSASLDFYAIALLRDKFLAENTLKLLREPWSVNSEPKSVRSIVHGTPSTVVLVTGGFHTPGITKILKEKGVSYITISPMVASHTEKDQQLYVARLMDRDVNPNDIAMGNRMLARGLNAILPEWVAARFVFLQAGREGNKTAAETRGALADVKLISLAESAEPPITTNSLRVEIPTPLLPTVGGKRVVEVERRAGMTVGDVLNFLGVASGLGGLLAYLGDEQAYLDTPVGNATDLTLIASVAGGAPGLEDTSIGLALKQARQWVEEKQFGSAYSLLSTLVPDLVSTLNNGDILKLVKIWNAKYPSEFNGSLDPKGLRSLETEAFNLRSEAEAGLGHTRARLHQIALQMAPPDGGILAADESDATAGKRLTSVGLENTPENQQRMRQMMLMTPNLKEAGINAVILYESTLGNVDPAGNNLVQEHLVKRGILAGLKTDSGLIDDPDSKVPGAKLPKPGSLDKLPKLLEKAKAAGAVFTKWRTTIPAQNPGEDNIRKNAFVQAQQARMTQDAGLVPIVEPEVVYDGSDGSPANHDLAASYATTSRVLEVTFEELDKAGVWLDGMVLKSPMVLAGKKAPQQTDSETVGFETLKVLLKTVPAEVPADVFLSGGQADNQATENLDAVIRASKTRFIEARDAVVTELSKAGKGERAAQVASLTKAPWEISYSFGRGLQAKPLAAWAGKDDLVHQAQQAMQDNTREVRSARQGRLAAFRAENAPGNAPHASTPKYALGVGTLLSAAGIALALFVSPWALVLLLPAALEFREAYEGVTRNMSRGMDFREAFNRPAALETENVAELQSHTPTLALHEFSHQLFGAGEVANLPTKYAAAILSIVARFILWVSRLGNQARLNPEQSRVVLGLEKLAAVSPIRLVNTASAAAARAFKSDAAAQEELIKQRAQMAAERAEHGAA